MTLQAYNTALHTLYLFELRYELFLKENMCLQDARGSVGTHVQFCLISGLSCHLYNKAAVLFYLIESLCLVLQFSCFLKKEIFTT